MVSTFSFESELSEGRAGEREKKKREENGGMIGNIKGKLKEPESKACAGRDATGSR